VAPSPKVQAYEAMVPSESFAAGAEKVTAQGARAGDRCGAHTPPWGALVFTGNEHAGR